MGQAPRPLSVYVDGRRINIALWGDPAAQPVVLIHGLRDHCRSWDALAHALAGDWYVIAPDLRGHGDSDWTGMEGYTLPGYVADIADVVEALGLSRYAIVGHSLGGAIGLRLAAAFPDRVTALAGIECIELPLQRDEAREPVPYPARIRGWLERRSAFARGAPRHYDSTDGARERMQREQADLPPETVAHLAANAAVFDQGKGWRWKFDPRVRLRAPEDQRARDLDEVLDAVRCPVLLFYGNAGWIPIPPDHRLSRLRHHVISRVDGGGHWLHHQFPERFAGEVLAFLKHHCRTDQHA